MCDQMLLLDAGQDSCAVLTRAPRSRIDWQVAWLTVQGRRTLASVELDSLSARATQDTA